VGFQAMYSFKKAPNCGRRPLSDKQTAAAKRETKKTQAGKDLPIKGPFAYLLLGPPFFLRARVQVEQRLHPLRTKTKCIAVLLLRHLQLLISCLLPSVSCKLQGSPPGASGNPLVFARKRDICAQVAACTTSRHPNHFQCLGIQSPNHPPAGCCACEKSHSLLAKQSAAFATAQSHSIPSPATSGWHFGDMSTLISLLSQNSSSLLRQTKGLPCFVSYRCLIYTACTITAAVH
jgi:hypothetical protein